MCDIIKTLAEIGCKINWEYVITILTIIGSSAAIIVSVVMAKKQRTADIVTKNRMEWIQSLRSTISDYYSKVKLYEDKQTPTDVSEYLSTLYICESKVKLQLNCFGKYDKLIIYYVSELNKSYDAFLHKSLLSKRVKDPLKLSLEMIEYHATYNKQLLDNVLSESARKYELQQLIDDKNYEEFLNIINAEDFQRDNIDKLLKMESNRIKDCCKIIRRLPDLILLYAEIYLKVEWERVKEESQKGNIKHFDFDGKFERYLEQKEQEIEKLKSDLPPYLFT